MSDALDYLLKARPEAMGHYFRFVREAGRSLDPKTRALISVITKVHAQTEAGFRQYLRRALRDGATPAEILDAMLMAFPALGLTRIVWAIDILQRMELPEFKLDAIAADKTWRSLGLSEDFQPGATIAVEREQRRVFVHRKDTEFVVYDARCPHRGTTMPATAVMPAGITCPGHGWVFDPATGHCAAHDDQPLTRLPSRIDAGQLWAQW